MCFAGTLSHMCDALCYVDSFLLDESVQNVRLIHLSRHVATWLCLPIKTNENSAGKVGIPVVGFRDSFIWEHLIQIKATTKPVIINNTHSTKNKEQLTG